MIRQSGIKYFFLSAYLVVFHTIIVNSNETANDNRIQIWIDKAIKLDKECNLDSSRYYYEKILNDKNTPTGTIAFANNKLSILYRKLGMYEEAIGFAAKAREQYSVINDSSGIAGALFNVGKIYRVMGKYQPALSNYLNAAKLFEKYHDTLMYCNALGSIANLYMDMGDLNKGKEYYLKSLELMKHFPESNDYADDLTNYGIVFFENREFDSALYYFKRAYEIYKLNPDRDDKAAAIENIGITEVYLGNANTGITNIHKAYKIFNELKLDSDIISVLLDLGRAYTVAKKPDSAVFYLKKAIVLSKKTDNTWGWKTSLNLLFKQYEHNRDYKNALKWHKEYVAFTDSIEGMEISKNLQELEVKYETAKRDKKIQALKDKDLINEANNRLLKTLILSIIIIFGFIFTILWIKRKKDIELHEQKLKVLQKEEALAKAEIERRQIKEKQLEEELEFKTKQLTTHSINMMKKNQLLETLGESIDKYIKTCDGQGKREMTILKNQLKQGLNVENDWELFNHYFAQINEDFFAKLKKINPGLTNNDFRLCTLIKLNMNVKEMASVMNISADSLKNARYRLKKKLNLSNDESLPEFIGRL